MFPLISAVSEILAILKNPTRLKILFLLSKGEKTYSELMREVGCDSGKFSFHLRSMKDFLAAQEGMYLLSPLGERLYRFIEGMEEVLMVVYVKPTLDIFVAGDGSARAEVQAEYNSPSRSILAEVVSYVGPARSFIELFVEKKASQTFGCKTKVHIQNIDYAEGTLKARATLFIEQYARKNGKWRIHYGPSALLEEIQNVPWDVEGNVSVTLHLPEGARIVKDMKDMDISGDGYALSLKTEARNGTLCFSVHMFKKKGILLPEDVLENILIDLEYEVIE